MDQMLGDVDTRARDAAGGYERHIRETLTPREGTVDLRRFLTAA
jgi:hypothetical protein